jgi:hypothetical protein
MNIIVRPSAVYRSEAQARRRAGDIGRARDLLYRAISAAEQEQDPRAQAMNVSLLAEVEGEAGNLPEAVARFTQAATTFEEVGDLHSAGVTYHQWGKMHFMNMQYEEAGKYFIASAECFLENNDARMVAVVAQSFRAYISQAGPRYEPGMRERWERQGLPPLG